MVSSMFENASGDKSGCSEEELRAQMPSVEERRDQEARGKTERAVEVNRFSWVGKGLCR